ncbi:hypothetical protein AKG07_08835 [Microbacterium sp. CGR1]|uniref:hypothetical protein n=1 Tax=Microbacterium sp. CGR1 TaxID=1696072 RepID=UPI00069D2A74|nr:hypothetical protein [Microbacterium sp. CGR1]AKV86389.1 hypothetical protein AKG07_08835 [Microbacterium sp. CGR1]
MAAEEYRFEYGGAPLNIAIDLAPGAPTTTAAPNLRVVQGSWKTWRLEADLTKPGLEGIRLMKSVSSSGGQHPNGNLSPAQSVTNGYMVMITNAGNLYQIAAGWGVASRFYTTEEWSAQLTQWAAELAG